MNYKMKCSNSVHFTYHGHQNRPFVNTLSFPADTTHWGICVRCVMLFDSCSYLEGLHNVPT